MSSTKIPSQSNFIQKNILAEDAKNVRTIMQKSAELAGKGFIIRHTGPAVCSLGSAGGNCANVFLYAVGAPIKAAGKLTDLKGVEALSELGRGVKNAVRSLVATAIVIAALVIGILYPKIHTKIRPKDAPPSIAALNQILIARKNAEITGLNTDLLTAQAATTNSKEKVKVAESNLALARQVADIQKKLLEDKIVQLESDIKVLKQGTQGTIGSPQEIQNKESEILELKAKIKDLEENRAKERAADHTATQNLLTELEQLKKEKINLAVRNRNLAQKNLQERSNLNKKIKELQEVLAKKNELVDGGDNNNALSIEILQLKEQIKALEEKRIKERAEDDADVQNLLKELEQLKKENLEDVALEALVDQELQTEDLKANIEMLNAKINVLQTDIKSLKEELQNKEQELVNLQRTDKLGQEMAAKNFGLAMKFLETKKLTAQFGDYCSKNSQQPIPNGGSKSKTTHTNSTQN